MDWIGLDWIGLDWVDILEKNDGLDWIGSKVLYIKIFTAIFLFAQSTYKVLRPLTITAPLQFWKDQAKQYSILSTGARRVFAMSASSAQSERDFSSVGRTVTDARSQLSASKVESIEILQWGIRAGLVVEQE